MSEDVTLQKYHPDKLPVIEIFGPTIQGEGGMIGVPTHFIRLGGCGYRCSWCDTMYAVLPEEVQKNATYLSPYEIVESLNGLKQWSRVEWNHVTLSGGDPCFHDGPVSKLITLLMQSKPDAYITVETQGQMFPEWLNYVQAITFSPKPPSSGMKPHLEKILRYAKDFAAAGILVTIKVVVANDEDLGFAKSTAWLFKRFPFTLQACTPQDSSGGQDVAIMSSYRSLIESALMDDYWVTRKNLKILPQLHGLIWPGETRGR